MTIYFSVVKGLWWRLKINKNERVARCRRTYVFFSNISIFQNRIKQMVLWHWLEEFGYKSIESSSLKIIKAFSQGVTQHPKISLLTHKVNRGVFAILQSSGTWKFMLVNIVTSYVLYFQLFFVCFQKIWDFLFSKISNLDRNTCGPCELDCLLIMLELSSLLFCS